MSNFKQMMGILKRIEKNNYYSITYIESYRILVEMGYLNVHERNLIQVTDKFINRYHEKLIAVGYTTYQILAFSKSPLHPVYFKNEMLAQYLNNPHYHFQWNHYRGSIISKESGVDNAYLKNICLAYDLHSREPIIHMFVGDVLKLDVAHQNYIRRFEIEDHKHLELNKEVVNNLIYGQFSKYEDTDIYNIIIVGMKIINRLFNKKHSRCLFKEVKESKEYEHFHPIFISSKINYYLFVLELYKMIYDNINVKTLKMIIIEKNPMIKDEVNDKEKWSLWKILEVSLGKDNFQYLKKLSEIRNEPAHDFYNNDINKQYWIEQDELLIETYKFINSIIIELNPSTPPEELSNYAKIFGPNGSISYGNGFNQTPYRFYDGQIRLVCERYQERDAEYLVAFKSLDNFLEKFVRYIKRKRPDLEERSIRFVTSKMFLEESHKPDKRMVESFFKGYFYNKWFYEPDKYKADEYIELGKKATIKFLRKYSLENTFVFADSTDPYFSDFNDCISEKILTGRGYITELIHFFREEYQYDNVVTDPSKNLKIQVLSNIWD